MSNGKPCSEGIMRAGLSVFYARRMCKRRIADADRNHGERLRGSCDRNGRLIIPIRRGGGDRDLHRGTCLGSKEIC